MDYTKTFSLNDVCRTIEALNEQACDNPTMSRNNRIRIEGLLRLVGCTVDFDTLEDIWKALEVPYVIQGGFIYRVDADGNEME